MPIPKANPKDKGKKAKQEFISRCVSDPVMTKEYPDQKQRLGICYTQWERRKKSKGSEEDVTWDDCDKDGVLVLL